MPPNISDLSEKLAVILHADVVDSTTLVQRDERLTHRRIADAFSRFSKIIVSYGGVAQEVRGDAVVAEFKRASDAVCAALAFQTDNKEHNAKLSDDLKPEIRIGISLGEVVVAGGTVTGAGVVLAQRVEQLAKPGGVCITGATHEALPQRLPFDQDDLGEQEAKGFIEPVRVFSVRLKEGTAPPEPTKEIRARITPATQWIIIATMGVLIIGGGLMAWYQPWAPNFEPASVEKMAFPLPDKPSIAILPFDNYSDDETLEFIASGLTDDLTTSLSKVPALFVIAGNSATTYKGKPVTVKQVAEELGVRYILEGSIQKGGEELRINTQLIDALSGHHLWAERFDRPSSDIFAVQDEITKRVIVELQVELTEGEQAHMAARGTDNLEAWLLRVQALSEMWKWTQEGHMRARELYLAAHELDHKWARPVAGLAVISWWEVVRGWSDSREKSIKDGKKYAELAISLDPDDIAGYQALSNFYFLLNDPERAIALRRKAIEIAPNDAANLAGTAARLNELGGEEEAVKLWERAIRLNPKVPWWFYSGYGLALHLVGRQDEAVQSFQKAIAVNPNRADTYTRLAAVYVDLNQMEEAKQAAKEALRLSPSLTIRRYQKASPMQGPKKLGWYKDHLLRSGLPE